MFLREFEAERRARSAAVGKDSDTQQQPGLEAANEFQAEKEKENQIPVEKESSKKPDIPEPEQVNGDEVAGGENDESRQKDSPADIVDHCNLEGAQVQLSTEGKEEELPTS